MRSGWERHLHSFCRLGMSHSTRAIAGGVLLLVSWANAAQLVFVAPQSQPAVNQDARSLADFKVRVDAYASLHRKVDAALPQLSKESTPQEIDRYQRSLLAGIAAGRAGAKPGDVFTPPIQQTIKTLIARAFAAGNSKTLRESIQDENPGPVKITVNGPYPDAVPLANMPAELLKNLPMLPEVVEYRFVGESLILLDSTAHLIVDIIPRAMPR